MSLSEVIGIQRPKNIDDNILIRVPVGERFEIFFND
jgi:hypothetical protein